MYDRREIGPLEVVKTVSGDEVRFKSDECWQSSVWIRVDRSSGRLEVGRFAGESGRGMGSFEVGPEKARWLLEVIRTYVESGTVGVFDRPYGGNPFSDLPIAV